MDIPLFWPSYDGQKIRETLTKLFPDDMSNRWLGQGKVVDKFEKEFGDKFGYKYCVSLNSGTSALELAYHLLGLKEDDEVITTVLTCTATNIPLLRLKCKIIFADINKDFTISYDDVTSKITKDTKAIVATTLGGVPLDERIFNLKIPVVIDACQSVGVSEKFGDYVCYSFQAIKHFTTGDGGMLVVRNEEDYKRAKKLRWFGIDREAKAKNNWQPYKKREMTMDIEEAGYKMHMNDIQASMGLVGLQDSDKWLAHRKKIADIYDREFVKIKTIKGGSYWLYGILVDDRDGFAEFMSKNGIETNMAHLRNDIFKAFGGKRLDLPKMNEVEDKYIYIPINTKMTLENAEFIADKVNEFFYSYE